MRPLILLLLLSSVANAGDVLLTTVTGSYPAIVDGEYWPPPHYFEVVNEGNLFAYFAFGNELVGVTQSWLRQGPAPIDNLEYSGHPEGALSFNWWVGGSYYPVRIEFGDLWQGSFQPPNGYNLEGSGVRFSRLDFVIDQYTVGEVVSEECEEDICNRWPTYAMDFTVQMYGVYEVPEPASLLLVFVALLWPVRHRHPATSPRHAMLGPQTIDRRRREDRVYGPRGCCAATGVTTPEAVAFRA